MGLGRRGGAPRPALRRPGAVAGLVAVIGVLVTVTVSFGAWRIDRSNEQRLLQVQTRQAANLISATILTITGPLRTVLDVAAATDGDTRQFTRFMSTYTARNAPYVSASLWRTVAGRPVPVASIGVAPAQSVDSAGARAFISRAEASPTFVVASISTPSGQRVRYALADPRDSNYTVYAERAIPADRQVPVEHSSAFADMHFATYLGQAATAAALQTTDVDPASLPLRGDTARESIPFGDTTILLVTSARGNLAGTASARRWWILLIGGLALTAGAAAVTGALARRRIAAEDDATTIAGLYEELDGLYAEQRGIAESLQHALLPERAPPDLPRVDIACRYVAGARGVDVGGDWYSVVRVDADHVGFVVGDVSGRGVDAAAVMARLRFTLGAYLAEGHAPGDALRMCSRQLDVLVDGHIATAVVGVADTAARQLTLASAGHLPPMLLGAGPARYLSVPTGIPLGVRVTDYASATVDLDDGTTFLAFTDGLIERRDEDLDVGLQRLADSVGPSGRPIEELLSDVLSVMTSDGSEDDIAMLAFRWRVQAPVPAGGQAGRGLTGS